MSISFDAPFVWLDRASHSPGARLCVVPRKGGCTCQGAPPNMPIIEDLSSKFKSIGELDVSFTVKEGLSFTSKVKATPRFQRAQQEETISTEVAEERAAATKRADLVLEQLPPGYYIKGFDALEFELLQLDDDCKQDDVDAVVERLTMAVEVRAPRAYQWAEAVSGE